MPASREYILSAYRVPDLQGKNLNWQVYQVGCTSKPLNFASQQMRAFALMWAVDTQPAGNESGNWLNGKRVAIVGGGFAGVTAGVVSLMRGAGEVDLYERAHDLIPLQHGSTRDIRPFIYKWPNATGDELIKDNTKCEFPILNWTSATAHQVRERVLNEAVTYYNQVAAARRPKSLNQSEASETWEKDRSQHTFFKQRLGTEVRRIVSDGQHSTEVRLMAEGIEPHFVKERNEWLPVGQARNFVEYYDLVIIATGFGLERTKEMVPFRSYWHTDSLAQPIFTGRTPWRVLISGIGDGGLTDAIRARLFDVDLKDVVELLCGQKPPANFQQIAQRAKELEKMSFGETEWGAMCAELREALRGLESEGEKIKDERSFGEFMEAGYLALCRKKDGVDEISQKHNRVRIAILALSTYFRSRERTDTLVYLNGLQPTPYSKSGSALYRFIVFILCRYCGLRYLGGEIKWPTSQPDPHQSFTIEIERLDDSPEQSSGDKQKASSSANDPSRRDAVREKILVDEVYIRHGAEPALKRLFGPAVYNQIQERGDSIQLVEKELWNEADPTNKVDQHPWSKWKSELKTVKLPKSLEDANSGGAPATGAK